MYAQCITGSCVYVVVLFSPQSEGNQWHLCTMSSSQKTLSPSEFNPHLTAVCVLDSTLYIRLCAGVGVCSSVQAISTVPMLL